MIRVDVSKTFVQIDAQKYNIFFIPPTFAAVLLLFMYFFLLNSQFFMSIVKFFIKSPDFYRPSIDLCTKSLRMCKEYVIFAQNFNDCAMKNFKSFNSYIESSIVKNWDRDALSDYKGITLQYHDVARKIEKLHIIFESSGIQRGDPRRCRPWRVSSICPTSRCTRAVLRNWIMPASISTSCSVAVSPEPSARSM